MQQKLRLFLNKEETEHFEEFHNRESNLNESLNQFFEEKEIEVISFWQLICTVRDLHHKSD